MTGSPRYRVVVYGQGYASYDTEGALLAPLGVDGIEPVAPGDVASLETADALLVRETPVTANIVERLRRCQVIVRYGVGTDNVDLDAARARRIYVANVPDYGADEVSDHALALLLSVARRVVTRDRQVRCGNWGGKHRAVHPLAGRTLGLVGYGRIARAFHRKVACLGPGKTLVYDPHLERTPAGVSLVELETLCKEAQIISLHAPLTPETRNLIGRDTLGHMDAKTILVNTARGGLIDQDALVEALRDNRIFGAGLDVFEDEPLAVDHPLCELDNVVLTDHIAWYSEASVKELQSKAAQEVARVLSGQPPISWVNRWEER